MSVFADLHEKKKEFFVFKKLFFLTQKRESAASAMGQREHFLFFSELIYSKTHLAQKLLYLKCKKLH